MKKTLLLIALLGLSGCAAVSNMAAIQARCAGDEDCLANTKKLALVGQTIASPWGAVAVNATGSVLTFAGLIFFGMKLNKKEQK